MSYNDNLPIDRDWVRFLIGDTGLTLKGVVVAERLSDPEIDALVAENPNNKYCAAAEALSTLLTRYGAAGEGVLRRTVDELSVEYGTQGGPFDAIRERISWLQRKCAQKRDTSNRGLFRAS